MAGLGGPSRTCIQTWAHLSKGPPKVKMTNVATGASGAITWETQSDPSVTPFKPALQGQGVRVTGGFICSCNVLM